MQKLKNVVYILGVVFLIFSIGYFIFSFSLFNHKQINQEEFFNTTFRSSDNDYICFNKFEDVELFVNDTKYNVQDLNYEDHFFYLTIDELEEKIVIAVVKKDILFSKNFNKYFYRSDKT